MGKGEGGCSGGCVSYEVAKKEVSAMKKWMAVVLTALMGLWGLVGKAWSDATPSNDSDALTITVTPNVDRGVDISTGAVGLNLGTLDLNLSTFTVSPASVTILGNMASAGPNTGQELNMSGVIAGGWGFDTTSPSTFTTTGDTNNLAVFALFSATTLVTAPSGDDFANATANAALNDASAGAVFDATRVGAANPTNGTRFEKQGTGNVDMDNLSPTSPTVQSHLWFFLRLPDQTTTANAQDVTVTLTAVDASS